MQRLVGNADAFEQPSTQGSQVVFEFSKGRAYFDCFCVAKFSIYCFHRIYLKCGYGDCIHMVERREQFEKQVVDLTTQLAEIKRLIDILSESYGIPTIYSIEPKIDVTQEVVAYE
ncbi:MAG: hypothetical protein ACJASL_003331 [Paraglaciecola sp.]|jgi:hypothetical protein